MGVNCMQFCFSKAKASKAPAVPAAQDIKHNSLPANTGGKVKIGMSEKKTGTGTTSGTKEAKPKIE